MSQLLKIHQIKQLIVWKVENQKLYLSEAEIAERVIFEHEDNGKGFRKISKWFSEQGLEISKDRVFRIYHKYRKDSESDNDELIFDAELDLLTKKLEEKKNDTTLNRAKKEKKRQIASLTVQDLDLNLEKRTKLFRNKQA